MITEKAKELSEKAKRAAMSKTFADQMGLGEYFKAGEYASLLMDEVEQNCQIDQEEFNELFNGVSVNAGLLWRIITLVISQSGRV